jgi:phage portal protein BeeE
MNLFGLNIHISRNQNSKIKNQKSFSPEALAWLGNVPEDTGHAGSVLINAYEQVVWVYRAINVLAEQIANIPFLFSAGERGRENLITSGPLLDFYNRPHPQITRFQYWELRVLWLMLRGECFRVPIYEDQSSSSSFSSSIGPGIQHPASSIQNPASRITHHAPRKLERVLILDPSHFHHIIENHELVGWRYSGFGKDAPIESQVFLPEEVWFEKLPNPFDFWRGLSPLRVADLAIRADFAAAAFMKGFMENNADNGLIIRTSEQIDDVQKEQLRAALQNRKRRAGCPDRPLLLWNAAEVIKPELSSADLQFLENRKFSRAEICAAFGVPEEIITTTDHAKYDVMQGARLNFIENRVAPLCARLEAAEDLAVKALDPRAVGWFDLDSLPIMQNARRARLAAAKTGFDMGIPFNELNRVLDLGFKPLPHGDTCYLPTNVQSVAELPAPASDTTPKQLGRLGGGIQSVKAGQA